MIKLDPENPEEVMSFIRSNSFNDNYRLWNQWKEHKSINLPKIELNNLTLKKFDFSKTDLSGADLRGADLSHANLS